MPGLKERPRATAASPLIKRVAAPLPEATPDPAPYLSERKVPGRDAEGNRVVEIDKYWTKRKLEAWLSACPTVLVHIPLDPSQAHEDESRVPPAVVIYDGFPFEIPKGQPCEVPAPIAEIVKQSQRKYVTSQAAGIDLFKIDVHNPNGKFIDLDGGASDPSDHGEE